MRLLSILFLVIGLGGPLWAAEFQIQSITSLGGRNEIRVPNDTGFYHILWRGDSVNEIRLVSDLALASGENPLTDNEATSTTQFYRVEKVPLTSLRDTDGDGISDAWELFYRHPGSALSSSDAAEDHNNNGVADRLDALRDNMREGSMRGRPVVAAGLYHTLAIQADGTLWAWGNNSAGELGVTGFTETNRPVQVGSGSNWVAASAGPLASYGLKSDGTLWAWGQSNYPVILPPTQIGTNTDWISLPRQQLARNATALRADGTIWRISGTGTNVQQIGSENDWALVANDRNAGTWGIKREGSLWKGLTVFDTNRSWAAVSIGESHGLALRTDGTLWAWATSGCCPFPSEGQLGLGINTPLSPTQVGQDKWASISAGRYHSIGIKDDGSLWWWGANLGFDPDTSRLPRSLQPVRFGTNSDWIAVSAGEWHSVALRADGTVWTFGQNELGKLGNGAPSIIHRPTRIGDHSDWSSVATGPNNSFGLKTNGTLWAWGVNAYGTLGSGDSASSYIPMQVSGSNWIAVSGGVDHSIGLRSDGTLWQWGKYLRTAMPSDDLLTNQPIQIGTNMDWMHISAGHQHALAIRQDGTLWSWGYNSWGEIGQSALGPFNSPIQVETSGYSGSWSNISAGNRSSIGIRFSGGTRWSWGEGVGGVPGSWFPDQDYSIYDWTVAALNKSTTIYRHAIALRRDGTMWAWGSSTWGQLGTNSSRSYPVRVGSETNWSQVSLGEVFSGAMRNDGTLWMTGQNFYGELGLGHRIQTNAFTRVGTDTNWLNFAAGARHVVAVKTDGSLWAWGDNRYGQCGQPAIFEPRPVPGTNWGAPRP